MSNLDEIDLVGTVAPCDSGNNSSDILQKYSAVTPVSSKVGSSMFLLFSRSCRDVLYSVIVICDFTITFASMEIGT